MLFHRFNFLFPQPAKVRSKKRDEMLLDIFWLSRVCNRLFIFFIKEYSFLNSGSFPRNVELLSEWISSRRPRSSESAIKEHVIVKFKTRYMWIAFVKKHTKSTIYICFDKDSMTTTFPNNLKRTSIIKNSLLKGSVTWNESIGRQVCQIWIRFSAWISPKYDIYIWRYLRHRDLKIQYFRLTTENNRREPRATDCVHKTRLKS